MANICGMESLLVFTGDMTQEKLDELQKTANTDDSKLNLPKYYCNKLGDLGELINQS